MLRRLSRKALALVVARTGTYYCFAAASASTLRWQSNQDSGKPTPPVMQQPLAGHSDPAAATDDPFFGFTTSTPHKFEVDRAKLVNEVRVGYRLVPV